MKKILYIAPQTDIVTPNCTILSGQGFDVNYSIENEGEIEANRSNWDDDTQQVDVPSKSSLWDEE